MQKKFSIKLTKPIVGKRFGVFQHIMKWAWSDKVDMRKYVVGDSASQINWKVSARHQELYTNIFQQEKSLQVDIFLDVNYNRRWGIVPNSEQVRAYASDILSYCHHEHIAVRFFYPKHQRLGKSKLITTSTTTNKEYLLNTLDEIIASTKTTKKRYSSLLADFLKKTGEDLPRRAIIIFSDFLTMDEPMKQLVHYLRKQHILFLFQLPIDPEQGQNYNKFLLKNPIMQNTRNEIELLPEA